MTSDEILDDLGGVAEIAERLGVKVPRVKRWIERRSATGCPEPVLPLHMGNVYSLSEWKGWFALWRVTRGSETWKRKTSTNE